MTRCSDRRYALPTLTTRSYTRHDARSRNILRMLDTVGWLARRDGRAAPMGRDNGACSTRWHASLDACAAASRWWRTRRCRPRSSRMARARGARPAVQSLLRGGDMHYRRWCDARLTQEEEARAGHVRDSAGMAACGRTSRIWRNTMRYKGDGLSHRGRPQGGGPDRCGQERRRTVPEPSALVGDGGAWVKVSGAHRVSQRALPLSRCRPFLEALVSATPSAGVGRRMAASAHGERDAGRRHLFEWVPRSGARTRRRAGASVDKPAGLYDFPK